MHIRQWARWSGKKSSLLCNEGSAKRYTTRLFSLCWSLRWSLLFIYFGQSSWHANMKVCVVAGNTVLHINETAPVRIYVKVEDVRIQLDGAFFPSTVFVNMLIAQRRHERDLKCLIARMRHRWVAASKKPTFSNWALFANAVNNGAPIERKYLFKSREQSQKHWNKMVYRCSPTPCPPPPGATFIPVPG